MQIPNQCYVLSMLEYVKIFEKESLVNIMNWYVFHVDGVIKYNIYFYNINTCAHLARHKKISSI